MRPIHLPINPPDEPFALDNRSRLQEHRLSSVHFGAARMLSWLNKGKGKAKEKPNEGLEHGHIEPIFDADPPLYFLYPHAMLPGSTAPKTTCISGKFLFILKQPEHLLAVFAQLTASAMVSTEDFKDTATLPSISCAVPLEPGLYQPGEYEMPFYFDVPCNYWGRSAIIDPDDRDDERQFGVMYTIDLHVTRRLDDQKTDVVLLKFPSQKQLDTMFSDHLRWRNLYHRRFFVLVPSPVDPGEAVPSLEQAIEEFAPQLGPINMIFTSRTFTIGSLLNFTVSLPAIPPDCRLLEIRGILLAMFEWHSFRPGVPHVSDKPIRYPLFTLGPASFELDPISGSLSASASGRLPNDRIIGPTTLKHTRTPLKCFHSLIFEFEVLDEMKHKKKITVKHPVQIASCMLISEQVNLPTYGSNPVPKEIFQPNRAEERYACACGFTFDQLMERENEGIAPEVAYEPPELKSAELRAGMSSSET